MKTNKKGFTIIEVVLVLAIAGLIFLMVFIALPALQRSQRNTQREDDIARFLTAVNDYQTNNSGKTPFGTTGSPATDFTSFVKRYIDSGVEEVKFTAASGETGASSSSKCAAASCPQFTDPDGEMYSFQVIGSGDVESKFSGANAITDVNHVVYVAIDAGCGETEGTAVDGSGDRQIAMFYVEEGGAIVCNDNH